MMESGDFADQASQVFLPQFDAMSLIQSVNHKERPTTSCLTGCIQGAEECRELDIVQVEQLQDL